MSIQESIKIVPKGEVALVEFDLVGEKVNKLSTPVMARLKEVVEELKRSSFKVVVLISRKPKIFIAGADIEEIKKINSKDEFQRVLVQAHEIFNAIEDLPKLVHDGQYGIGQIAEIVSNLRNFSRLDRKKVDRFNVADGLESTLSIARHLLKTIEVKKNFGDVPPITCSPSQLNQVFLNLVTNAAQATDGDKGEIWFVIK